MEYLRQAWGFPEWKENSAFHALVSEAVFAGEKILLAQPLTYMNLSGDAIVMLLQYYRLDARSDLIVITDDLDMEFAKIRYKESGSHGGQNGLKDIIAKIGNNDFSRIKIGIGRDAHMDAASWVLSRLSPDELQKLHEEVFPQVAEKILHLIRT